MRCMKIKHALRNVSIGAYEMSAMLDPNTVLTPLVALELQRIVAMTMSSIEQNFQGVAHHHEWMKIGKQVAYIFLNKSSALYYEFEAVVPATWRKMLMIIVNRKALSNISYTVSSVQLFSSHIPKC